MNQEAIMQLRQEIVKSAQELALQDSGNAGEQLQLLMELVRSGDASVDVIRKAYELTSQLNDNDLKLANYLDLLTEIDVHIVEGEQSSPDAS